ncbi:uncharacterized protein LOC122951709 [Acropora millepora]|uniref:uncharacterized protein LOC122951709 n=1 Tax=Acropora millepora TaxID=45264 RepID=UPI001CF5FEBF|nr:uncharacterized protein LOC122951709 [Acropora millepora]
MADESSDVSMTEQLAVCIRYLNASSDDEASVNKVFLGFVELSTTDASTITDSLLGNLSKWGLDTERLRGMGFDGAPNMSGAQSGVQSRTCDLVKAHTAARNLVSLLAGLRTEEKFGKLYARAMKVAQTIEVLPSKPRTTVRQMHRANAPAESIPDFYRLNYYYPFLDHVIQHMNDRFPEPLKGALQGTLLIPSNLRKLSTSVEEAIKKEFAEDPPIITSLAESVASCVERLYPNISTIFQLLLTLPVGSCSSELSFSALRRLKTWCCSSIGSNRLNGLALAYVHSEIHVEPLQVLQHWDASGHRRVALAFNS